MNAQHNLICMLIGMQENVYFIVVLIILQTIEHKHVSQHVQHNGSILEAKYPIHVYPCATTTPLQML